MKSGESLPRSRSNSAVPNADPSPTFSLLPSTHTLARSKTFTKSGTTATLTLLVTLPPEPGGEAHAPTSASAERQEELVPPAEQNNGLFNAPERANHEHPVNENPPQVLNQEENTQIAYLNLVIMGIAFAILAVLLKKATSMI